MIETSNLQISMQLATNQHDLATNISHPHSILSRARSAASLASNIAGVMSNIGMNASARGSIITIATSANHATQLSCAVSGSGATDTITLSNSQPVRPLHKQQYYFFDAAGNRTGVQGDSSGSLPSGLTTNATQYAYNCGTANMTVGISPECQTSWQARMRIECSASGMRWYRAVC